MIGDLIRPAYCNARTTACRDLGAFISSRLRRKCPAMDWLANPMHWAALFAGCACALSVYLLLRSFSAAALPGCGAGGGCDAVLSSRWSKVGPVPVTGPGALLYLVLSISALVGANPVLGVSSLSIIAVGAALWFMLLQAIVVRRFCPYCTLAHLCGLAGGVVVLRAGWSSNNAATVLVIGLSALGALIAGQLIWPAKTYRIEVAPSPVAAPALVPPST